MTGRAKHLRRLWHVYRLDPPLHGHRTVSVRSWGDAVILVPSTPEGGRRSVDVLGRGENVEDALARAGYLLSPKEES